MLALLLGPLLLLVVLAAHLAPCVPLVCVAVVHMEMVQRLHEVAEPVEQSTRCWLRVGFLAGSLLSSECSPFPGSDFESIFIGLDTVLFGQHSQHFRLAVTRNADM